jgi:hypothetical protein
MVSTVPEHPPATAAPGSVDPAVREARRVVGLYGDPDVTWSIVLRLRLVDPHEREDVAGRVPDVFEAHPHLGRPPVVEVQDATTVDRFANEHYGDHAPLVRLALDDSGRDLVVAAHHGAVDGLGLVGLAGRLSGLELGTSARGVSRTGQEPGFLAGTLPRLGEIVFRPPERFRGTERGERGDHLVYAERPLRMQGTGALAWAGLRALRDWNAAPPRHSQPVIALGVSRRPGQPMPRPDRDTAYTRLRVRGIDTRAELTDLLGRTQPEPDFPVTDARGLGAVLTRRLAGRLGASMLVSNLGLLAHPGVASASFWPVASGPHGVSLGLVSAGGVTTLTARVRRGWFTAEQSGSLLDLVGRELAS